jgi:twitching motility protein PilT
MEFTVDTLLRQATEARASDLHLRVGMPPMIRIDGDVTPAPGRPVLDKEMVEQLVGSILDEELKRLFYENKSVDFSHAVPGVARFRVAFFLQQGVMGGVFRRIPEKIPTLADLGAPAVLLDFARRPRGLVLVTGPTGSGKSTTLAAVIDVINRERFEHILTIEDPIEFVHPPQRCIVNQREIGRDAPTFARALRDGLRQDPDVILVGEMRDLETISTAITAAETGHLVFGTLHTSSAPSSIDRIIDAFPADQQQQIRVMLAGSLIGIVTQTLLPRADGQGRVAAHEVLVADNAVRAHIRHQQMEQVRSVLQTQSQKGMQTMDKALVYLVTQNIIAEEIARERTQNPDEFEQLLRTARRGGRIAPPNLVQPGQVSVQMPSTSPTMPTPGGSPPAMPMPSISGPPANIRRAATSDPMAMPVPPGNGQAMPMPVPSREGSR